MSLADQQWCPTSVQVTVLQARGLRIKGKSGTNDAYAVMQLGKEKFQTSVVEKSVAPVWKEEATFDLPPQLQGAGGGGGAERSTLHVHVLHRALVGPDKLLGQAVFNLPQLSEDETRNKIEWFKLLDKTGKPDKDRGEVLVDIQFMRNNMTASMFDLSAAGKSRSRLGKFKDKVRGKKKESDSASSVVPSLPQVLTDSEEEEGNGDGVEEASKNGKSKKHKMKSLFSPKSNLQRNMSQSMSVLPAKNSSLSGSQSSGLNVDSSEGKKKFKFMIHKRSSSSDIKDSSSGHQKSVPVEQSNLCINGSHIYCEEPPPRTSRTGSNYSLASSGHGSMEDVPDNSPPSVDSLRATRQYSPWMEEEEDEEEKAENIQENVDESKREEEERIKMEKEERRRIEEEEKTLHRQKELESLAEEKLRQEEESKKLKEKVKRDEEERIRKDEENKRKEVEKRKREEEERIRRENEQRRQEEEERAEQKRQEERKMAEEKKLKEEEERKIEEQFKLEEEQKRKEERAKEERKRQKAEEEMTRKLEELKRQREEEERLKQEEVKRQEEAIARKEKEEFERLMEEKRKIEEEKKRIEAEEKLRMEEEMKRKDEERRREEELEEKRRHAEQERRRIEQDKMQREEEERIRKERLKQEEETLRQQQEEAKEKLRQEEEERRMAEEEKVKREEEERIRREEEMRRKEQDMLRRQEEERLAKEILRQKEEERKKFEEMVKREEEERIKKEMREKEEEKTRKEKEAAERLAMETKRLQEQEKRRIEEEARKKEEERIRREESAEKERKEKEAKKLEEEILTREVEECEKKESGTKDEGKAAGNKSKVSSPTDITSNNPFDENTSVEIPSSSSGPHSHKAQEETVQERCWSSVSVAGSRAGFANEKVPVSTQREKRPAPRPPGKNQAERRSQDWQDVSEIKQTKDKTVKTVSVLPQRSVQIITPQSKSTTDSENTQSVTQSNDAKITSARHGKRPAPSRPPSVEEPSTESKTTLSHQGVLETKQSAYGMNPFEDDEDENELTAQDDTAVSGPVHWPPIMPQNADKDASSQVKVKSLKMAHAPPPPAKNDTTSSNLINHNNDGGHITGTSSATVANGARDPQSEARNGVNVLESPNQGLQQTKVKTIMVAGVKEDGPSSSRRLQPVKPLNPPEQQSASVQVENNKSAGILSGNQAKTKVDSGLAGPYSQLTREELISLVLKQENQLSDRDKKISELEQYIDNLLVRVMEEKPSILMSMSALKKAI
ncbi:stress response protein NST1 [Melanotaenia boesemani]|uniref:stress response protein NST1 n=1 Tax=Melanotaenia boesemani TaxID=1250792 RepID=UPI001C03DDDC|nr:stress response protein NST1 [Melanotaenia boesemani]